MLCFDFSYLPYLVYSLFLCVIVSFVTSPSQSRKSNSFKRTHGTTKKKEKNCFLNEESAKKIKIKTKQNIDKLFFLFVVVVVVHIVVVNSIVVAIVDYMFVHCFRCKKKKAKNFFRFIQRLRPQ